MNKAWSDEAWEDFIRGDIAKRGHPLEVNPQPLVPYNTTTFMR